MVTDFDSFNAKLNVERYILGDRDIVKSLDKQSPTQILGT